MYTVSWMEVALDALADAFVQADLPTRDLIERVVARFNTELASDPTNVGESRPGRGRRIALDQPCAITFVVNHAAGTVRVTHFWTY
jgi:hypothetical protein